MFHACRRLVQCRRGRFSMAPAERQARALCPADSVGSDLPVQRVWAAGDLSQARDSAHSLRLWYVHASLAMHEGLLADYRIVVRHQSRHCERFAAARNAVAPRVLLPARSLRHRAGGAGSGGALTCGEFNAGALQSPSARSCVDTIVPFLSSGTSLVGQQFPSLALLIKI